VGIPSSKPESTGYRQLIIAAKSAMRNRVLRKWFLDTIWLVVRILWYQILRVIPGRLKVLEATIREGG